MQSQRGSSIARKYWRQGLILSSYVCLFFCLFVCHLGQLLGRCHPSPHAGQQAQEGEEVVSPLLLDFLPPDILEQLTGEDNVARDNN